MISRVLASSLPAPAAALALPAVLGPDLGRAAWGWLSPRVRPRTSVYPAFPRASLHHTLVPTSTCLLKWFTRMTARGYLSRRSVPLEKGTWSLPGASPLATPGPVCLHFCLQLLPPCPRSPCLRPPGVLSLYRPTKVTLIWGTLCCLFLECSSPARHMSGSSS